MRKPTERVLPHEGRALLRARRETETALANARKAHARLREAIDILPHGLVFLDEEGRYVLWNQQYAEIYRATSDLFEPGAKFADTLRIGIARGDYPDAAGREEEWLAERLAQIRNPSGRLEQRLADGRVIMIEERATSGGGVIGLRVDITDMKRREESFKLLFDGNPVPMFVCALNDAGILAANDAAVSHYGYARDALLTMQLEALHADGEVFPVSIEAADNSEESGKTWRHRKSDGDVIDVAIFSRRLDYDGRPAALLAIIDITERKQAEARIAYMAHHDALTGLANRVLLRLKKDELHARQQRTGVGFAVLCLDLDHFKGVNDTLGHACGDALLRQVADRLRGLLREHDIAARLGGDEFAIIQSDVTQPEQAGALAQRVIAALSEPYALDGHHVQIGVSVGVSLAAAGVNEPEALLKHADMALYRAKADGRGTFRFFEPDMDARVQARHRIETDLRAALQLGHLQIHYQPLVDLTSMEVTGVEALVRWPHAQRGMIPPSDFISIAEETGLIAPLGAFVLSGACHDAASWPQDIKVAVNLSPLQFRTGNLFQQVKTALEESGLAPHRLELEITETLLLDKGEHVLATLHALRALGVRISMDDFGTGYSSLSYLRSFPFDKIKIDRSFIHGMCDKADSRAIVRAIVSMGTSLGITITAEGVEDIGDLRRLQAEGCNEGQGYLFSNARPSSEIAAFLRESRHRVA